MRCLSVMYTNMVYLSTLYSVITPLELSNMSSTPDKQCTAKYIHTVTESYLDKHFQPFNCCALTTVYLSFLH